MPCFTLGFIEQLCIYLVWICVIVGILKLLVPLLAGLIGGTIGPVIVQIVNLILWGVIAIFAIIIIFDLLGCLLGAGGGLRLGFH